ncbi:MAG: hypothetical protein AABY07_00855 [Nanoarchaeota archaeon]
MLVQIRKGKWWKNFCFIEEGEIMEAIKSLIDSSPNRYRIVEYSQINEIQIHSQIYPKVHNE